jgi:hypothetical protein
VAIVADKPTLQDRSEINVKTKPASVALLCAMFVVSGCGSSSQDLIVGKWEAGEAAVKLKAEFDSNGTAKLNMFGQTLQGTYKLNGDDLEWTMNGQTTKCRVKLSSTEMELVSNGKTIKYKKI